jgi:hypothetical protein
VTVTAVCKLTVAGNCLYKQKMRKEDSLFDAIAGIALTARAMDVAGFSAVTTQEGFSVKKLIRKGLRLKSLLKIAARQSLRSGAFYSGLEQRPAPAQPPAVFSSPTRSFQGVSIQSSHLGC